MQQAAAGPIVSPEEIDSLIKQNRVLSEEIAHLREQLAIPDPLLTTKEVTLYTRGALSEALLNVGRCKGKSVRGKNFPQIPFRKIGGSIYYLKSDIDKYLQGKQAKNQPI